MNIISRIEKFIFESRFSTFVFFVLALAFVKTGVWYIPNLSASQIVAHNPFVNPFPDPELHYLLWSWLGPFMAWLVGVEGFWQFFLFHLLFSLLFTALFIRIVFHSFPGDLARVSLIIFSALPVSATAYFWVGGDSITLFLLLLALAFPKGRFLTFFLGILIGIQHFEQGFFASAALLLAVGLSHRQGYFLRYSWQFCLMLLVGIIVGKILLYGLFVFHEIDVNSGRLYWLAHNLDTLLSRFFLHFQSVMWSILGLGWLVALRFSDWGKRALPFFVALALVLPLVMVSDDQTRVLAVITFPLVSAYWLFNKDFLENLNRREVSWLFSLWFLIPWGWVWKGLPKWSAFPYDLTYFLHRLFGWFSVPENPALWPFQPI